jgi:hypothetical protein
MVGSRVRVSPDVVVVGTVSATSFLDEIIYFFPLGGAGSSTKASSAESGCVSILGSFSVCCCCAFSVGLAITLICRGPLVITHPPPVECFERMKE